MRGQIITVQNCPGEGISSPILMKLLSGKSFDSTRNLFLLSKLNVSELEGKEKYDVTQKGYEIYFQIYFHVWVSSH